MAASQKNTSYEKKNSASNNKNTAKTKTAAGTKGKNTTPKKSNNNSAKNTDNKKTDAFIENKTPYYNEIILGTTLVISGLLLLSLFGLVPKWIMWLNDGVFGLIGVLGYIFPFALLIGVAFGIANQGNTFARRKLISSIGLFWIVTAFLQFISTGYEKDRAVLDYFKLCAKNRSGGGLFGGLLMSMLCKAVGSIAACLILVVVSAILIMFITDRFIFSTLGKNGLKQMKNLKTHQENMRAERKRYYEEMEEECIVEKEVPKHEKAKIVTFPKNKKLEYTGELDTKLVQKKLKQSAQETSEKNENGELTLEEREAILRAQKKSRRGFYEKTESPDINTTIEKELTKETNITEGTMSKKVPLYKEILMNKFKKKDTSIPIEPSYTFTPADTGSIQTNKTENQEFHQLQSEITDTNEMISFQKEQNDSKEEMTATITDIPSTVSDKIEYNQISNTIEKEEPIIQNAVVREPENIPDTVVEKPKDAFDTVEESAKNIPVTMAKDEKAVSNAAIKDKSEEEIVINRERKGAEGNMENEPEDMLHTSVYDPIETEETDAPEVTLEKLATPIASPIPKAETKTTANAETIATTAGGAIEKQSIAGTAEMADLNKAIEVKETKPYVFPPIDLLTKPDDDEQGMSDDEIREKAIKLKQTLDSFGVRVTITDVSCGPTVTRFELQPEQGVKVSKITGLTDDIKLNLAAADIRIEAPIPGKAAVGIEVPNNINTMVMLRDLMESKEFKSHKSNVAFAVGKDIGGKTVVTDVAKMPHLLIAGATGSGKSVCINTLIMSILYKADPKDVKLIMIDPKVVELSVYNGIPHLLIPVVTDPKKASGALSWAVSEMTDRYNKFAELGVREINGYNEKVAMVEDANDPRFRKMPQIVIIVDELADLMMVEPGEVEESICRLAQLARAAGIHLVIATQRPSVNVITGLIKANIPSRIAFSVSSAIDSRTILDGGGAEKLLGKGDMLFFPSGFPKPVRVQGAFVSDKEVTAVVDFLKQQVEIPQYNEAIHQQIETSKSSNSIGNSAKNDKDDYFIEAGKFIIEKDKASIGMLQRVFKVGFNRAARIMDQLSEAGVVGPEEGTKPRKVLMSLEQFENYIDEYF